MILFAYNISSNTIYSGMTAIFIIKYKKEMLNKNAAFNKAANNSYRLKRVLYTMSHSYSCLVSTT